MQFVIILGLLPYMTHNKFFSRIEKISFFVPKYLRYVLFDIKSIALPRGEKMNNTKNDYTNLPMYGPFQTIRINAELSNLIG